MGWDCPRCTFKNANTSNVCDMCEYYKSGNVNNAASFDDGEWTVASKTSKSKTSRIPNQRIVPRIIDKPTTVKQTVRPTNTLSATAKPKATAATKANSEMKVVKSKGAVPRPKTPVSTDQSVLRHAMAPPKPQNDKSSGGTINCPFCTLENPSNLSYCLACDSSLPLSGSTTTKKPPCAPVAAVVTKPPTTQTQEQTVKSPGSSSEEWLPVKKKHAGKTAAKSGGSGEATAPSTDYYANVIRQAGVNSQVVSPASTGPYGTDDYLDDEDRFERAHPPPIVRRVESSKANKKTDEYDREIGTTPVAPVPSWGPTGSFGDKMKKTEQQQQKVAQPDKSDGLDAVDLATAPSPISAAWANRPSLSRTSKETSKPTPTTVKPASQALQPTQSADKSQTPTPTETSAAVDFPSDLGHTETTAPGSTWGQRSQVLRIASNIPEKPEASSEKQHTVKPSKPASSPPALPQNKLSSFKKAVQQRASTPASTNNTKLGGIQPQISSPQPAISSSELFKREKKPPRPQTTECGEPVIPAEIEVQEVEEDIEELSDVGQETVVDPVVEMQKVEPVGIPTDLPPLPEARKNVLSFENDVDGCFMLLQCLNHHRIALFLTPLELNQILYHSLGDKFEFNFDMQYSNHYLNRLARICESEEELVGTYQQLSHEDTSIVVIEVDVPSTSATMAALPDGLLRLVVSSQAMSLFLKLAQTTPGVYHPMHMGAPPHMHGGFMPPGYMAGYHPTMMMPPPGLAPMPQGAPGLPMQPPPQLNRNQWLWSMQN